VVCLECDREASQMEWSWPTAGCRGIKIIGLFFCSFSYTIDDIYLLRFVGMKVGHQTQPKKINREMSENSLRKQMGGGQNNTERVSLNKFFTM
jgi:hypothetical protein